MPQVDGFSVTVCKIQVDDPDGKAVLILVQVPDART